jgi:hypothetical protein
MADERELWQLLAFLIGVAAIAIVVAVCVVWAVLTFGVREAPYGYKRKVGGEWWEYISIACYSLARAALEWLGSSYSSFCSSSPSYHGELARAGGIVTNE